MSCNINIIMKLNIGFFIHTLGRGGAEQALVNLVNNLPERKYDLTIYTIIETGDLISSINSSVKIKSLIKIPRFMLKRNVTSTGTLVKGDGGLSIAAKAYVFFWKWLPKSFYKVLARKVGSHDLYVSYLEGVTMKFVGNAFGEQKRKIAWIHVDILKEEKSEIFYKNLNEVKKIYKSFDQLICVSNTIKESIRSKYDVHSSIEVIYNVYEDEKILEKSLDFIQADKELFFENKINIVSVGRLAKQKGYDRLINAVSQLPENLKQSLNIIIIGEGEDRNYLEKMIIDYELTKQVNLIGFRANPYSIIKNSDIFISSSITEGFSTVIVESLILETPIIATNCSGTDEILNDGEYGMIIDNSTQGLLDALELVLGDSKNHIKRLKEKATKGSSNFNLTKMIYNHEELFKQLKI